MNKFFPVNIRLQEKLQERQEKNLLRKIPDPVSGIDFCSNDYLGFSRAINYLIQNSRKNYFGSTGSRLISGNYSEAEQLEKTIAEFHGYESALLYNSGYVANIGLVAAIADRGDTIFYDQFIHASIRDGIKLSNAHAFSFLHNDIEDLKSKLINAKGTVFVIVESIYSMDGDTAPLIDLVNLSKAYNFQLIVDEAHAIGVFGNRGEGMVFQQGLNRDVFATVVTYGKAFGSHGAAVLGSKLLIDYLINFSRSFIYTTAMPLVQIDHLQHTYERSADASQERTRLFENISYFKSKCVTSSFNFLSSDSPIQILLLSGNDAVKKLAEKIQKNDISVKAIMSPTVPEGKERIRICLHSFNTKSEIDLFFNSIKNE